MATKPLQTTPTDIQGNVDTSMPAGAKSLSGQGGLTNEQASGIQDIYKANLTKGMTPVEAQAAIKADPAFAQAKAAYNAPAVSTATPFVPNAPENPQTNLEVQRNAEQAKFNAANPVGTNVADIKYTPPADIKPIASVEQPQATSIPKTTSNATTAQPMAVPGVDDMATLKLNADDNRKREILGNLDEGFKNDAEINKAITTGDYETYKSRYEYDTADENKKRTLDAYFQAKQPKDVQGIYNILKTGARIASKAILESPLYATAKAKADIYNKYSGMTSGQLLTEMKNGNIGTELDKELRSSPEYQSAKAAFSSYKTTNDINKATKDALDAMAGKAKEDDNTLQKMSDKATADVPPEKHASLQTYMKENAPELTEKVASFNKKNQTLRELSDERDNMLRTVIADHPGISKGAAMVLASRNNESLNDQIKSMSYDLQTMQADINYATEIVKADYDYVQKKEASSEAFNKQKELAQFQQDLSLQGNQAEFEQKLKQQAELASDPYTAIQTVMDQYAKLGVPFTQSIATKVADAQAFIKAGGTIGGYVDKMIKDIQEKDEYKAIKEKALNTGKFSMGFDPITGSPYVLNQQTGTINGANNTMGNINVSSGNTRNRPDRNNSPGNVKIGDVGYGVDDQNHTIFGSPQEGYAAMVKDITAKLTGGSSQKSRLTGKILSPTSTLADLGSVYAEDPKWAQSVARLSGYSTSTKLSEIDVNKLAPAIAKQEGFTGNISSGQASSTEQFTPSKKLAFDSYTEAARKGTVSTKDVINLAVTNGYPSTQAFLEDYNAYKNTPTTQDGLTAGGFDSNQVEVYKRINSGKKITDTEAKSLGKTLAQLNAEAVAYGKSKDMDGVPAVNDLISTLNELRNAGKVQRVTSQIPGSGVLSGDTSKFLSNYNSLIAKTSLQNLIDLKNDGATFGALSNQELAFIKDASDTGKLRYDLSDEQWKATIDKLIANANKVKSNIVGNQSTPTQTQSKVETPVEMLARLRKAKGG